jgi:hypothetical protein
MRTGRSDTSPLIEQRMLELYRRMTPAQKANKVFDLMRATRELAALRIRAEQPTLSEREVQVRVAALIYGRELVARATGIDPGADYD